MSSMRVLSAITTWTVSVVSVVLIGQMCKRTKDNKTKV